MLVVENKHSLGSSNFCTRKVLFGHARAAVIGNLTLVKAMRREKLCPFLVGPSDSIRHDDKFALLVLVVGVELLHKCFQVFPFDIAADYAVLNAVALDK